MARAGLRWGVRDLADKSRVGRTTIVRFEGEQTAPNPSTRAALRRAFEDAGVEFIGQSGVNLQDASQDQKPPSLSEA
jgi:hypothetical protein